MKKEDLIKELEMLPDGVDIYLFNYNKNTLKNSDIIENYKVEMIESFDDKDFAVISFE